MYSKKEDNKMEILRVENLTKVYGKVESKGNILNLGLNIISKKIGNIQIQTNLFICFPTFFGDMNEK